MIYNIRQVTNFSSAVQSAPTSYRTIFVGNRFYRTIQYYILSLDELTGSSDTPINKLGYVCEPRAFDYPILITTGGETREIAIGKTGMYEVQPEVFKDTNVENAEEIEILPKITSIMVPKGPFGEPPVSFKLDYAFLIN